MHELQRDGSRTLAAARPERSGDRPFRRERLDHPDIADRLFRGRRIAISGREGALPDRGQPVGVVRREGVTDRGNQVVLPIGYDIQDRRFEGGPIRLRSLAPGAADDELDARQRALGKERIERRDMAVEGAGEIIADQRPDAAVVAVARHIDDRRYEAVEAVAPRQHADPRPFVERHDRERELEKGVLVDLKQLVAWKRLEYVGERPARMAGRIETGAGHDRRRLPPDIGNGADRAGIGVRREEAEEAGLAGERAVGAVAFDPDIVGIGAAMHARDQVRLGDVERLRAQQEFPDGRGRGHALRSAAKHAHRRVGEDAEAGGRGPVELAFPGAAGIVVVADAEEGEVAVGEPLQKGNRLGAILLRDRRRIPVIFGDDRIETRQHRRPIGNRAPHFDEERL